MWRQRKVQGPYWYEISSLNKAPVNHKRIISVSTSGRFIAFLPYSIWGRNFSKLTAVGSVFPCSILLRERLSVILTPYCKFLPYSSMVSTHCRPLYWRVTKFNTHFQSRILLFFVVLFILRFLYRKIAWLTAQTTELYRLSVDKTWRKGFIFIFISP